MITARPADVVSVVNALDGVKVQAEGSGEGLVATFSVKLEGGEDEPFPLNTPVAVAGTALINRLGDKGTLKQALTEINDQRNALTVVVRVADETDGAKKRAAILKGIGLLSSAKSITTYQPRIVIAPGFSEDDAVGKAPKRWPGNYARWPMLTVLPVQRCRRWYSAVSPMVPVLNCCDRVFRLPMRMAS